jgi:hypothetical protein
VRPEKYILDDTGSPTPVDEDDYATWGTWYADIGNRRVAETTVGDAWVSTVFLTVDHNWSGVGPPILWETMIFDGEWDQHCWRYSSVEEARASHAAIVAALTRGEPPPDAERAP